MDTVKKNMNFDGKTKEGKFFNEVNYENDNLKPSSLYREGKLFNSDYSTLNNNGPNNKSRNSNYQTSNREYEGKQFQRDFSNEGTECRRNNFCRDDRKQDNRRNYQRFENGQRDFKPYSHRIEQKNEDKGDLLCLRSTDPDDDPDY